MAKVEQKETFGERVKRLRAGRAQTALAAIAGITQPSWSAIESGETTLKNIKDSTVAGMAKALGVSEAMVRTGREGSLQTRAREIVTDSDSEFAPVRRGTIRISAGVSGYAIEYENSEEPPIFFRKDWIKSKRLDPKKMVALKVIGESMENGLFGGDTVVVNTADKEQRDGEVYAVNFEGELVIKRLKRDSGEWWLASDNPDKRRFPDKRCSANVFLLGRVIFKNSERI